MATHKPPRLLGDRAGIVLEDIVDMNRLAKVTRAWKAAQTSSHEDLAVADGTWLELRRKIVGADRVLREPPHRDGRVRALVLRVGFRSSITPLPIHHPYLWGEDPLGSIAAIREYGELTELREIVDLSNLLDAMVAERAENPLWTAFLNAQPSFRSPTVVGIRRHSALDHLEPRFKNLANPTRVATLGELGNLDERRTTVFFGPASVYPGWVKLFPRSKSVWIRHAWNRKLVFPDALSGVLPLAEVARTNRKLIEHPASVTDYPAGADRYGEPDELAEQMNKARLASELEKASNTENSTTVASRIGVLANDDYVLLPTEEGTMVTVFDPQLRLVRREHTRRLIPGMFVVVRERGGRDHLRSLVETRFLKNSRETRSSMQNWKTALARSIRSRGIDRVASELSTKGVQVGHSTIRLWTTDLVHGPGSKANFEAVARYLGLTNPKEDWEHVLKVRRAGRLAGNYMRRELLNQASRVSPQEIQRESTLRFTLAGVDGGALVAVKIDEVLPEEIQAPVGLVGQLIEGV